MVDRATHKIVQLLQMFEEQHGMVFLPRNIIHMVYECGIVLLKEAATVPFAATKRRATALEASHVCVRALRGASRTWPWAEQLAVLLERKLNETQANSTIQSFSPDWTDPGGNDHQAGPHSYQIIQVWPSNVENSAGSSHTRRTSGLQIDSSATVPSIGALGLEITPPQQQAPSNPTIGENLGDTTRSTHIDPETGFYDMISFSGTPSSSTASYPLDQKNRGGHDEETWEHPSF
ncbi:hypothetical protein OPQ81_000160 [Rhizoctonia solani]|nr:hypothetical protein OPQ81_000160 [Rhizoctonia solani]